EGPRSPQVSLHRLQENGQVPLGLDVLDDLVSQHDVELFIQVQIDDVGRPELNKWVGRQHLLTDVHSHELSVRKVPQDGEEKCTAAAADVEDILSRKLFAKQSCELVCLGRRGFPR